MKDKALRILTGESKWEDFSGLLCSPGWAKVAAIPKLPAIQRFIILALAQDASSVSDLARSAGLYGSKGLVPAVKAFWRTVALRLVSIEPYRAIYRTTLNELYQKNEALGFAHQAQNYLLTASSADRTCYSTGKLPLSHIKLRARMDMLCVFFQDLLSFIREDV